MKRFLALIFSIIMSAIVLTSCGMGSGDTLEISNVTAVYDETTGETTVTISYLDDVEAPLVFVIPKGEQGVSGNGIDKIVPVPGATEGTTDLMIYFTDGRSPYKVTVSNGKDGASVTNIKILNEQPDGYPVGSKEVVFVDQNEQPIGNSFVIPAGKDGDEISNIYGEKQDNGTVKVTVVYKGNSKKEFTIPGGRGIANIDSGFDSQTNEYLIVIQYTDDSENTTLRCARPTGLLNGISDPHPEIGIVGDFYIDTENKKIFKKISETDWEEIIDLKNDRETFTVKFVADSGMSIISGKNEFEVQEGKCFLAAGFDVPIPYKTGHTFKGWYTTREPNATHGAFTDLTPVTCQLTLYAVWEEN